MSSQINSLTEYAESITRPLKVLVIDPDKSSFDKVINALAPFNAEVFSAPCACPAAQCIRFQSPLDLIFIGLPLTEFGTADLIIDQITQISPDASIVVMAKNPIDNSVTDLLDKIPFTFLKKNGTFDAGHVQRIARHLNLKLRRVRDIGEQKTEIPQQQM